MQKTKWQKPLCLLVAALLALSLLVGCASKASKVQEKLELGQKYLTELNYTEAVASFTEAIALDPDNIAAYMGRAEAYIALEQYEEAKTDYSTVIEKAEDEPYLQAGAYVRRADIWELIGDAESALQDYQQAADALERVDLTTANDEFRKTVQAMKTLIEEAIARLKETDLDAENGMGTDFQAIMDAVAVESEYTGCKRYVLVNDYDGDGQQEAFGFFGNVDTNSGDWAVWKKLHIYYLTADGNATCIYEPDDEFSADDMLEGHPLYSTSADPTDFSMSYLSAQEQTFALFDVAYAYGGDCFTMALTVYDGKPVVSYADSDLRPAADGFFVADGYDNQNVYVVQKGEVVPVGTAASTELVVRNNGFTDKNTPEKAWEKYEAGIQQFVQEYEGAPASLTSRVITADYDGDGRQEAYAILEAPEDEIGTNWAHVYYIDSNGYIFCVRGYVEAGAVYGSLRDDSLLTAGNQKFLLWEMSAGGSGSSTLIFGVKNGVPYEPEVSGAYQMFQQSGSGYMGTTSDFSKGYHDYIDHNLTFDAASGEFTEK